MDKETIRNLRQTMGTDPAREAVRKDEIFVGCQGIDVELIDGPVDPYKAIFEGATATWGSSETWAHKWDKTSDEGKLMVLLAALSHKTLPLSLEAPKFTFAIEGPSRAAFDQQARARIGVGYCSSGTRDNSWLDASLRIPHSVFDDVEQYEAHARAFRVAKDAYELTVSTKRESWQSARFILPMGTSHRWMININYLALQGMCAQRLKFCEQFDLVGTTWLMRQEIEDTYPLLAAFLRPGCDFAGKCQYHSNYALSDLFGALFRGCGRHKVEEGHHAEFNCACSTSTEIEGDLPGLRIPRTTEWHDIVRDAIMVDDCLEIGGQFSEDEIEDIMKKVGL
jgi:hypothetical protein